MCKKDARYMGQGYMEVCTFCIPWKNRKKDDFREKRRGKGYCMMGKILAPRIFSKAGYREVARMKVP